MVRYVHLMNTAGGPLPLDFTLLLIFSQQRKQINTIFSACGHPTNFTNTTHYSRYKIILYSSMSEHSSDNFSSMKQSSYFFQQGEPFSSEAFAARYISMSSRHLDEHWIQPGQHSAFNFCWIALNIAFELCIIFSAKNTIPIFVWGVQLGLA